MSDNKYKVPEGFSESILKTMFTGKTVDEFADVVNCPYYQEATSQGPEWCKLGRHACKSCSTTHLDGSVAYELCPLENKTAKLEPCVISFPGQDEYKFNGIVGDNGELFSEDGHMVLKIKENK